MKATATEVKNHFGEFLEKAQRGPIMVEKSGRMVAVLLSREDYDRLQALEDRYWGERALEVLERGQTVGHEEAMQILNTRLEGIEAAEAGRSDPIKAGTKA